MTEWPRLRVRDICSLIVDCVNRTAPIVDVPTAFRMIRTTNVREGRIDLSSCRYVDEATFKRWTRRASVIDGDVILTREAPIGEVGFVKNLGQVFLGQRIMQYRPNPEKVDPRYLYYAFRSPELQHQFGAHDGSGSVVSHIRVADCHEFRVPIPPMWVQERIADLLGSLDDRIEVNRRVAQTLETMAQTIFRDWFIDFGPTRRKLDGASDPSVVMGGLVTDSTRALELADLFPATLGPSGLPHGWTEHSVGDAFNLVMGQSPPGSTYNEAGDGLPFFQGRRDFTFRFPEARVYCTSPTRIADTDWTLVSVRAPVGDVNRAETQCCIGRGVAALCHKGGLRSFTYYATLSLRAALARFDGDGTVFGSVNQKQLKSLKMVGGNLPLAEVFDAIAKPMDEMVRARSAETRILAATRDLLLPKLMSGQLRLDDAERELEAAQ